jgi:hypothetical protein
MRTAHQLGISWNKAGSCRPVPYDNHRIVQEWNNPADYRLVTRMLFMWIAQKEQKV